MSPLDGPSGPRNLYVQLVARGAGDPSTDTPSPARCRSARCARRGRPFDRHAFACALSIAVGDDGRLLTEALGLPTASIDQLCDMFLPGARSLLPLARREAGAGKDALEEPDLRQLLLDHRSRGVIEEDWLAAIIARRSLRPNHLWQDLGLFNRSDLGRLLHRHFEPLAKRNVRDMKWKKFFYRELCMRDDVPVCKAPVCDPAPISFTASATKRASRSPACRLRAAGISR